MSYFLVRLGGNVPSDEVLIETMQKYDAVRKSILEAAVKLSARQYAEIIEKFGKDGPDVTMRGFSQDISRLKGLPLAIIGGPLMKQDFEILEMAEQAGGRFVLNATETGERGFCAPFDRKRLMENPLMELAEAYNSIPDASRRPNSELYKWLKTELAARNVRGIIFHRNVWCDLWHAELQRFKEWTDLPVLDMDSTGDSQTHRQRNLNRIRAFIEMFE